MRHAFLSLSALSVFFVAGLACSDRPAAELNATEPADLTAIEIPQSLRAEHEEIHSTLVEGTRAEGAVGEAARALAAVLDPHFVREEQIALPPLGLLSSLAAGASISDAVQSQALAMSDSLKAELPGMLQEHVRIRAAVGALRAAAQSADVARYEQFAEELALHAQTEEEVLYPAAVLVGDLIRSRRQGR
ncbi:MAG: hemerythrin domain-containing protein [Gemmatimonadaceae bacterium]